MLRIDVDQPADGKHSIPRDNPFSDIDGRTGNMGLWIKKSMADFRRR